MYIFALHFLLYIYTERERECMLKHFFTDVVYDQQSLNTTSLIICSPFNQPLICHKIIPNFILNSPKMLLVSIFTTSFKYTFNTYNIPQFIIPMFPRSVITPPPSQSLKHKGESLPSRCAYPLPKPLNQFLWHLPLRYLCTPLYPHGP